MDNFMDKLAQRYNAGEMIKANSEAEAAEMQNLQEQVEAYEAVLQEMRKLNYKNTELTEKMYSLVDESIEKVRTLQIEASTDGANTELISREMSDAVTGALNEALNNMDSTVARTISESLANALAQPTEEIKQTTALTENVGNKVDTLVTEINSIKDSSELVFNSVEDVKVAMSKMAAESQSISEKLDNIIACGVKTAQDETVTLEAEQVIDENAEEVSLSPEMIQMMKDFSEKAEKFSEMLSMAQATIEQNKGMLQTISLAQEANRESMAAMNDTVHVLADQVTGSMSEIDGISSNVIIIKDNMGGITASVGEAKESVDSVANLVDARFSQLAEGVDRINEKLANDTNAVSFDEESKNYITNIWNSVETTRNAVAALNTLTEEKAANNSNDSNEDIKNMMAELTAGNEELKNSVKNVKLATDENKSQLKASFDSAIYGLKQDNKEIVEFIQRMNTNILAKQNDPDKEQKEEEARQREEENKRALEERFKTAEDFMHKESVKVYRNVQAVINEKSDQQTAGLESKVKANSAQISQVKVVAIIAAALSGLTLVAQVLSVFNIL